MAQVRLQGAALFVALVCCCSAQTPKSVTYLRLGQQIVVQRSQPPAASEDWSTALRQQYIKAGIPAYQIVEQTVPGSSQRMVMCILAGTGDGVIVVSASLERPKDDDAAAVAWASLAMLPLLAESLNAVSTDSSFIFIAFPGEKYHHPGSSWYVKQLTDAKRKKTKAAVEIFEVGRGVPTFDVNRRDRYLAQWLETAALALGLQLPIQTAEIDSQDFPDAKQFRSASVPAITVSSLPLRTARPFSSAYLPINKLDSDVYYTTYELLCVFLLDLDRAARGASPQSTIGPAPATQPKAGGSVFTEAQANQVIFAQVNDARTSRGVAALRWAAMPELRGMACEMVRSEHLATGPFERLLTQKQLSGIVAVSSSTYPSLTPEQMQGLKVGRFHKLSVATCVVPSAEAKGPTYWIAALAYE